MSARILVTGGSGFIGRRVVAALAEACPDVHTASLDHDPADPRSHRCDLLAPSDVERVMSDVAPTHLVHLAWYVEHGAFWRSAQNLAWVGASLDLVRRFVDGGGRRLVVAGSCAEYDWRHGYCVEGVTPCTPATLYGTAKDALRRLVESYATERAVSWAWGRIFHLYGPGEPSTRLVPSVTLSLAKGEAPRCTHGRQVRDLMHVDDVGRAFAAVALSEFSGPVNISTGDPVRLADVVLEIASHFDGPAPVFGALPAPALDPPLLVGDSTRLRALGFAPRHTLATGIADVVADLRSQR